MVLTLLGPLALLGRFIALAMVPLAPEEAYYWMYAQHPNLSYFDHPPMIAWLISLGTALFGDNEFGVRVISHLLMLGVSVLLYEYGKAWFSRRAAIFAAAMVQVLPMYFATGFIATMDSALLFFWMVCLLGLTAALKHQRVWGWYLAGAGLGLAMLSKYTGVFLAIGAGLAIISHRPWRHHLRSWSPYMGLLLAVTLFSPVLAWNARHDWASFRFQFLDRFGNKPLGLGTVMEFLFIQVLTATPMVLWVWAILSARLLRGRRRLPAPRWIITLAFSLPLLTIMAYKSLRYSVHLNWTLPLFLSLFPALAQMLMARMRQLRSRQAQQRWGQQVRWTALICLAANVVMVGYLLALQPSLQWFSAFGPWARLARIVEEHEDRLEEQTGIDPLIIADGKYRLASVLAFYRKPIEPDVDTADYTTSQWILAGRGLGYPYWTHRPRWHKQDCILVVEDDDNNLLDRATEYFESVQIVNDPRLRTLGRGQYQIAIGRGLKVPAKTVQPSVAEPG
jgi:dolichol-phosphate mannosyltransferase